MKTYSDNAVTKADLTAIDIKQSRQIKQLRVVVGICFTVNLLLGLAAYLH